MPRNIGTNIYIIPPDTEGIPDQTIESATYNTYIHDVETDLNTPRPIIAGGTGANDADEALANLGAEKAAQIVTNYDTHVWIPGSFRSAGSATAGPVDGHAFAGIVYLNENYLTPPTNANVVVSARDMNDTVVPSRVYVREKKANVWGPWTVIDATTLPFPPGGGITGDTILEAIQELDAKKASIVYVDSEITDLKTYVDLEDVDLQNQITALDTEKADITYVNTVGGSNFDGMSYLGMQTNGSFIVNQDRNPGVPNTVPGAVHITDGWRAFHAPLSNSQIDLVPRGMNVYTHRPYNTPAALAAGDAFYLYTGIEGFRSARLTWGSLYSSIYKVPMTISFLSSHHRTGLYCISVQNSARDRSYVATYTQAVADAEEYQVITIPPDTTGTWLRDNGVGVYIYFVIAAGSNHSSPANSWVSSSKFTVSGAVNAYQDTADRFRISGVMMHMGTIAPPLAQVPNLVRPYDEEFTLCQRYYQAAVSNGSAVVASGTVYSPTTAIFSYRFPVQMRVSPTFSAIAPSNFAVLANGTAYGGTAITSPSLTGEVARLDVTSSGMTTGHGALLQVTSTNVPSLIFNAGLT